MTQRISGKVSIPTPAALNKRMTQAMEATVNLGQQIMKDVIDTSGTEYSNAQGREGRVATGSMRNDVKGRTRGSGAEVVGEVGWIDRYQDYYGYQDQGTSTHYYWGVLIPGKKIPGMFALRDAEEVGEQHLLEQALDIAKDLKNGRL